MDDFSAFFPGDELTVLIELHGQLFIHKKDVMHLAVKVRVTVFAIVPDPERFDIRFIKDCMDRAFMDR